MTSTETAVSPSLTIAPPAVVEQYRVRAGHFSEFPAFRSKTMFWAA
ncbi:MAG: hypothetical protein H0T78_02640 [Longispora sp.]|nr:hypothetical protein [Longispora sp. (in: high G+C Gram-positive bacteria)]